MRENDYTGSPLDDDDDSAFLAADVDLYEFSEDDEALADEYATLREHEQVIRFAEVANGAKTLREAAEQMFEFADDLVALADDGWEIVDDITNGHGIAVQFDAVEEDLVP